jgi:hypothetical protein
MSLDVYLTMPAESGDGEAVERIYVRREGRTEEITRAEWDEQYPDRAPVAVVLPDEEGEVYWRNITHNLGKMASEAGLYDAMWGAEDQGWTHAHDLIEPLRDGLATLQADPERFKQFNPANGWGDYEGLLDFAASYLAACMKWPDAEVRVSR